MGTRFSASVQTGPGAHPAFYTMGTASISGVKRPGRGVDHPPSNSTEVTYRVELYLCYPSGPLWPVVMWTLTTQLNVLKLIGFIRPEQIISCYIPWYCNAYQLVLILYHWSFWHKKSREFRQMKRSVVITWGANRNMKPPLSCPSTDVLLRFYRKIVSVVGIEFKTQIMSGCRSGDCVIL